jgi:hypothetical protein
MAGLLLKQGLANSCLDWPPTSILLSLPPEVNNTFLKQKQMKPKANQSQWAGLQRLRCGKEGTAKQGALRAQVSYGSGGRQGCCVQSWGRSEGSREAILHSGPRPNSRIVAIPGRSRGQTRDRAGLWGPLGEWVGL